MAEPARKDPVYDDEQSSRPVTRPDLRALEGGGEGDGIPAGNLHSVKDGGAGDSGAASSDDIKNAEQGGGLFSAGDNAQKTTSAPKGAIAGAAALAGGGIGGNTIKNFFVGSAVRKRNSAIGTVLGLALAGFGFFSIAQGPFQFIHIAQILEHSHFADQQSASNDRMGKLYRYLRSCSTTCEAGETRLGFLSSRLKTTMLAQLKDIGLEPNYGNGTIFESFNVDTTNENSPYHNMDEEQVRTALADSGIDSSVATVSASADGKTITVKPNAGFSNSYLNKSKLTQFLTSQTKNSVVPDAIRARVFKKYGFVNWHPLRQLSSSANGKVNAVLLGAWEKARDQFISTGEEPVPQTVTSGSSEEQTSANNQATTPGEGSDFSGNSPKVSETLKSIATGTTGKVAGGLATAVGLLCTIQAINNNIGDIRYHNNILPMMRLGTEAVTVGNQVMNGSDVDANELSYLSKQFSNSNDNWSNAQTFQADAGEPLTGADLSPSIKDTLGESSPGWLGWIGQVPGLGALCNGAGSVFVGVASFTLGIFSGGIASTVIGVAAGYLGDKAVLDNLPKLIAGNAIDTTNAKGSLWGNVVNYGARFFANDQAVQSGGIKLSSKQVAELNTMSNSESQSQFDKQSVAYRLFNPSDDRTLVSKIMDQVSPGLTHNVASLSAGMLGIGQSLMSLPGRIFGSIAHAESANNYQYPFPQYGFSAEDLDNQAVKDPYANATAAQQILDSSCLKGDGSVNGSCPYISKAAKCFNVNITKTQESDGKSYWDVVPGASDSPDALNLYNNNPGSADYYNPSDCAGGGDTNWLHLRFFIFDTGVMEGYACYRGDLQSCTNDGF